MSSSEQDRRIVSCGSCDGTGSVVRGAKRVGSMSWQHTVRRCSACRGTGRVYAKPSEEVSR